MENDIYTLITGGSKGIGKAIALECASRKMNILIVALPDEDINLVSQEITQKFNVKSDYLGIDLTENDGPENVYKWCKQKKYNVNILVNNAGIAGSTIFENSSLEYSNTRIQLNIRALVLMTRLFIPDLKKSRSSYILNIGSLSAYYAIPYKSVYAASKAFVVSFSTAINDELKDTSVFVSVVCPNGVETNKGTFSRIKSHGMIGSLTKISPSKLARYSITKMFQKKVIIIPKRINRFLFFLEKIIPEKLLQQILLKEFQKEVFITKPINEINNSNLLRKSKKETKFKKFELIHNKMEKETI